MINDNALLRSQPKIVAFQHGWLITILTTGLALRIFAALHPVDLLFDKTLPDDAFYYFQIARHIAQGNGATFDGLAPTNGFHPLWMGLIIPLFAIFSDDTAIHAALILSSCLDIMAAWMLYRVVNHLTGQAPAGIVAALIYALNPTIWMFAVNGLETALTMAVVAVTVERLVVWQQRPTLSWPIFCCLGLLFGLTLLARTDMIFLVIISSLAILFTWRQTTIWLRLRGLLLTALIATLITVPWFWWNYQTFGTLLQVSGTILPYIQQQMFWHRTGFVPFSGPGIKYMLYVHLYEDVVMTSIWSGFGRLSRADGSLLAVGLPAAISAALIWHDVPSRQRFRQQMGMIAFLPISLFVLFLYHSGIRWVYREWYILPISWTLLLIVGLVYALVMNLVRSHPRDQQSIHDWVAALLFALLLMRSVNLWRIGIYPGQSNLLALVHTINQLPAETRVGVADSGYVGFRAKRTVVNLDGVVNNQAASAMFEHKLIDYILATQIEYVYTQPRYLIPELMGPDFERHLVEDPRIGLYQVIQPAPQESKP